jgi:hypothetical protein
MLARFERRNRDLGMTLTRRAHIDQVDVLTPDELLPVRLQRRPAQLLRRRGDSVSVATTERDHFRGQRQVEEPTGRTPRLGVCGTHEGVPDHPDAESGSCCCHG